MRAYLPTTLDGLALAVDQGSVAWTDDVVLAPDATEEGEYDALMTAAELSADLLGGPGRRVVVVAEVPAGHATAVALRDVVAVHADLDDRPADADPADDLAWFATQEIGALLESAAG